MSVTTPFTAFGPFPLSAGEQALCSFTEASTDLVAALDVLMPYVWNLETLQMQLTITVRRLVTVIIDDEAVEEWVSHTASINLTVTLPSPSSRVCRPPDENPWIVAETGEYGDGRLIYHHPLNGKQDDADDELYRAPVLVWFIETPTGTEVDSQGGEVVFLPVGASDANSGDTETPLSYTSNLPTGIEPDFYYYRTGGSDAEYVSHTLTITAGYYTYP